MKSFKLCITLLVLGLICVNSQITEVNQQFFESQIQSSKEVWIIFSTEKSKSDQLSLLEQVSEILSGMFKFGTRSVEAGKYEEGDIHLYGNDKQDPVEYSGKFQIDPIVSFVLKEFDNLVAQRAKVAKSLKDQQEYQRNEADRAEKEWKQEQELRKKSDVLLLNNENWDTFVQGRDAFLINFLEANCSECIELNKEWESLATQLKGQIKVAKINITEGENEKLEETLEISKYPSVRYYSKGNKNVREYSLFEGVHKKFSIKEWAVAKHSEKIEKANIPSLNKQNYESLCATTKATCVIFFIEQDSPETLKQIETLQLKHISKPISFLIAKKGEQSAFETQVEVKSYPDVVMMFCKRKQIWHEGGMDLSVVDDTINEISLGNRQGFSKYKFAEQIV